MSDRSYIAAHLNLQLQNSKFLIMLSKEEVKKVADLARIEITDQEAEKYSKELSDILGFVEKLNEADTDKIGPIAPARLATQSVAGRHITGAKNATREDKIIEASNETKEGIIKNFPEKKDRFDKVKAVF